VRHNTCLKEIASGGWGTIDAMWAGVGGIRRGSSTDPAVECLAKKARYGAAKGRKARIAGEKFSIDRTRGVGQPDAKNEEVL